MFAVQQVSEYHLILGDGLVREDEGEGPLHTIVQGESFGHLHLFRDRLEIHARSFLGLCTCLQPVGILSQSPLDGLNREYLLDEPVCVQEARNILFEGCLLYTSDAADE